MYKTATNCVRGCLRLVGAPFPPPKRNDSSSRSAPLMPFFLSVSTFNKQIRERLNNKKNPQVMQLNGTAKSRVSSSMGDI